MAREKKRIKKMSVPFSFFSAPRMHVRQVIAVVYLAGLVALPSCSSSSSQFDGESSGDDPSVVVDEKFRVDPNVENGTAYDRAAVDLGKARKVVLPDTAPVRRAGEAGKIQLFMAKTLSFGGHPPEPMSIRGARKNMGAAVRAEKDSLLVATYGEWDSRIEGGAHMKLVAVVPDGVEIEQRKGLSGPESAGREWHGQYLTKPKEAKGGYWYGPASSARAWTAIPAVPDPDRTAAK